MKDINTQAGLSDSIVLELLLKALAFYSSEENYKKILREGHLASSIELDRGEKAKMTIRNINEILGKK